MNIFKFASPTGQPRRRRVDRRVSFRSPVSVAADRDICEENVFLQMLYLERRRSERSNRPLCLVLLDGIEITEIETREAALLQVFERLHSSVREIDTIGWFKHKCTLAVLFSELSSNDKLVVDTIRAKVISAVAAAEPKLASKIHISVHLFPEGNDLNVSPADFILYSEFPDTREAQRISRAVKRLIDIAGSLLLLSLFAPLLALVALAIKLTSKGPVIFRQARVGQYGKLFSFWKFRSMYVGNDATIHKKYITSFITHEQPASTRDAVYKITDDPRVTPLGRFLRKTSVDELPQLWNVLRGEMSLVGPRPPLPYELDCYALWHRRRILDVKPGITGLWQITGRSRTTFNEMVRLDLRYVKQWSIWLDIKILLQTPKAVLMGEGAY